MCRVVVTISKQNRDSLSNSNSTYVQDKDIDVHVPECDNEDRCFDTDGESDSSLKPLLSCDLKIMKKICSHFHMISFQVVIQDQNLYLLG